MEARNSNKKNVEINNSFPEKKDSGKGRKVLVYLGVGLGIVAVSAAVYYLFFHEKSSGNGQKDFSLPDAVDNPKTTISYSSVPSSSGAYSPKTTASKFPLKKGSRGQLVKQLQESLIKTYGKSILPKYGADGDFGSETASALTAKGYLSVVDEVVFNKIVKPSSETLPQTASTTQSNSLKTTLTNDDALKIAADLITTIKERNATAIMQSLLKIKNVADYTLVNEPFKTFALDGHNQTIVNAVLSAFEDDTLKIPFKSRFLQIGLKYNEADKKWSLSGTPSPRLITICDTIIRNSKGFCLEVPSRTIIGHEKCRASGTSTFTTLDGQELFVPSKHIRYV